MNLLTKKAGKLTPFALVALLTACGGTSENPASDTAGASATPVVGQSNVVDNESERNVVQVAVASPDHSTLVKAVTAADLVNALSNAGPFTVYAPVNEAFAALPPGTVEDLLKPEAEDQLADLLQYHVALGVFKPEDIRDGQVLGMVNGGKVTFHKENGQVQINGATIIGTVPAANGLVCVIDKVLLPGE